METVWQDEASCALRVYHDSVVLDDWSEGCHWGGLVLHQVRINHLNIVAPHSNPRHRYLPYHWLSVLTFPLLYALMHTIVCLFLLFLLFHLFYFGLHRLDDGFIFFTFL